MRKRANICNLAVFFVCIVFGTGCSMFQRDSREETSDASGEHVARMGFDPLELKQDKQIVPAEYPQSGDIKGQGASAERSVVLKTAADGEIIGIPDQVDTLNNQVFRVQLFTSKLFGEAQRARMVAEEVLDRPVFLDYEVPYFKVRVGGFATREAAEAYQMRSKAAGYSNAWVVMVNVGVREQPLLHDVGVPQDGDSLRDDNGPENYE